VKTPCALRRRDISLLNCEDVPAESDAVGVDSLKRFQSSVKDKDSVSEAAFRKRAGPGRAGHPSLPSLSTTDPDCSPDRNAAKMKYPRISARITIKDALAFGVSRAKYSIQF